ncbi:MAG: hypothetical protein HN348_12015 [Proteobacteria bacterium]|nr:hypothetical protein [Pseudomonadota bacterium]
MSRITPAQFIVNIATGHEYGSGGWTRDSARSLLLELAGGKDLGIDRKAWHRVIRRNQAAFDATFGAGPKPAKRPKQPAIRSFWVLDDLVQFLISVLETNDWELLGENCLEELPSAYVLNLLRKQHEKTPLNALYAKAEFPAEGTEFKLGGAQQLGGRQRELGHIQIDIVKGQRGWILERICMWR